MWSKLNRLGSAGGWNSALYWFSKSELGAVRNWKVFDGFGLLVY